MNSDYDSDGGEHVTYRHHEKGLHMGQQSAFSDEFQISLWSKKKGKLSNRNDDDARILVDEKYSFQLSQDFVTSKESRPAVNGRIITVHPPEDTNSHSRDEFPQPTKRSRPNDLDLPAHWRLSHSKIPQKPRSRLQHSQSLPLTKDAKTSSMTVSRISRPQPLVFTTAALPLSSNAINNSSSSKISLVPSKPSWLPQVPLLSKSTSSPHIPQQEDIVDDSFDHSSERQQSSKLPISGYRQRDIEENLNDSMNTFDQPSETGSNSFSHPQNPSINAVNETRNFASPSKSKTSRTKVGSLRWKFEKIVRESSNLENYLSSSDLASVMLDPRGRVNFQLKSKINKVIGFTAPFFIVRIFVNTFDSPAVFKDKSTSIKAQLDTLVSSDDINGVYHALALLKPNGAQDVKLRDKNSPDIILFDPLVLNASKVSPGERSLFTFVQEDTADGISVDKIFVCSVWEIL